jgi:hypothetical protein
MSQDQSAASVYLCPMHSEVRQPNPGKCPKCGMDLLPEGTKFAMLRHMSKSPVMIVVMGLLMLAIMYMAFM